jgi:hypothetical protein
MQHSLVEVSKNLDIETSNTVVDAVVQPPPPSDVVADELFDVRFVFHALRRGLWVLVLAAMVGAWFGGQRLMGFSPVYIATMTVAPEQSQANGPNLALRSLGEGFGLNFGDAGGGGPATTFDRLQVTIGSQEFVRHLEEKYDIIHTIYAGSWDEQTQSWIRPQGRRFDIEQNLKSTFHLPTWSEPTTQSFAEFLSSVIVVETSVDSPFTTVSHQGADPEFALWLLETVYREADAFVREVDLHATYERKAYLEAQISQTNVIEFRQMFVNLLANEERRLMLTQTDLPYAAQIIEEAFVSSRPTSPDLIQDFWILVFAWVLVGILVVLLFALVRGNRGRA